jgi:CheY-like chemotaxis protein
MTNPTYASSPDGWEVLRRLRADDANATVPVVVFTAHLLARDDAPPEWRSYEHFLTKPFKPDELLEAVALAINPAAR